MKKNFLLNIIVVAIACIPVIYLLIVWNSIPETVSLHFDTNMQPDKTGSKKELWLPVLIVAGVSIGVFFLLENLPRIDPKQKGAQQSPIFNKLSAGLVTFLALINFFIIISAAKGSFVLEEYLFPSLGLLFAFIGNYMNNIKPNYFAGFRLPWTLSDDDNWRKTHHLASKIWFAGGIFLAAVGLFVPIKIMIPVFFGATIVMVIIPTIYSYRLFKAKK